MATWEGCASGQRIQFVYQYQIECAAASDRTDSVLCFGYSVTPELSTVLVRANSSESLRLRCLHSACKHRPVKEADDVKMQLLNAGPGNDAVELPSGILVDDQEETEA